MVHLFSQPFSEKFQARTANTLPSLLDSKASRTQVEDLMIRFIALTGLLSIFISGALSQPQVQAVVNAASFQPGLPAGGSLATAFCGVPSNAKPRNYIPPSSSTLPFELAGIT